MALILFARRLQRCRDRCFELGRIDEPAIDFERRRRLNAALFRLLSRSFQRRDECFGCERLLKCLPIKSNRFRVTDQQRPDRAAA